MTFLWNKRILLKTFSVSVHHSPMLILSQRQAFLKPRCLIIYALSRHASFLYLVAIGIWCMLVRTLFTLLTFEYWKAAVSHC